MKHLRHPDAKDIGEEFKDKKAWTSCGKFLDISRSTDDRAEVTCRSCLNNPPARKFTVRYA